MASLIIAFWVLFKAIKLIYDIFRALRCHMWSLERKMIN